jgi:hypothetical protein
VPAWLAESTEAKFVERRNTEGFWPDELAWAQGHAPRQGQEDNPPWEAAKAGSVYSSQEFLQAALDEKEQKLSRYRDSGCDEYWMLLVASGIAPSSSMLAPDPQHVFTSSFDRVFFFQLLRTEITEMKCEPAVTSTCKVNTK